MLGFMLCPEGLLIRHGSQEELGYVSTSSSFAPQNSNQMLINREESQCCMVLVAGECSSSGL